ncbi:hypothetical protein N9L68_07790 [bacterium]|nr:hypothetical protein [bacterium]
MGQLLALEIIPYEVFVEGSAQGAPGHIPRRICKGNAMSRFRSRFRAGVF